MEKTTKKLIWIWHCHHDILLEPLTEPLKNRIEYIKNNKSKNEIELRLKLLKPVKGKLPDEIIKVGKAYYKAQETSDKVGEAYYKTWEAYIKTGEVSDKAWEAYYKPWEAYYKMWEAYVKVWEVYDKTLKKYSKEINELHEKECPNCPWQNGTIFSNKI